MCLIAELLCRLLQREMRECVCMRRGLVDTLVSVLPDIPSDLVSRAGERERKLWRLLY